MENLKLNYKRTFIIGFAFFAILMLWQVYNNYCPLYLKDLLKDSLNQKFGEEAEKYSTFIIGVIMALDNLLALFMLPVFGKLSDNTKSKYGKRMPYIVLGMIFSIIVFPFISVFYIKHSLFGVILFMLLTLIIMNVYRNPAVALMPDITPKPLRSKANGIINLVGYLGAIFAALIGMIFPLVKNDAYINNKFIIIVPFLLTSIFLVVSLIILILKINEPKILEEVKGEMEIGEKYSNTEEEIVEGKKLSKKDKKNMWIILISVFLWYMAFNAIESFNSIYFSTKFGQSAIASTAVTILTVSSVITFIPAGNLAIKIGRKKSVIIGILLLILGVGLNVPYYFLNIEFSMFSYISFIIAGIGWAIINVNSYPMIVEMSHKGNVGLYTGYYYTFSMLAQTITPILMGAISTFIFEGRIDTLYIYSFIVSIIALLVFINVKEGKNKITIKKGLESFDQD